MKGKSSFVLEKVQKKVCIFESQFLYLILTGIVLHVVLGTALSLI